MTRQGRTWLKSAIHTHKKANSSGEYPPLLAFFILRKMEKTIRAKRNGVTRNFHPNTWAMFPADKYGFVAIPPDPTTPPPVVIAAMQSVAQPESPRPVKQRKPRKKAANKI